MEVLYQLVEERNTRETIPFVAIHEANATLLNQVDALQSKCDSLERELVTQQDRLESIGSDGRTGSMTQSAALKNETRLREKVEKLQEEVNDKLEQHADDQAQTVKVATELAEVKDVVLSQEKKISSLQKVNDKKDKAMEHMTTELNDAKSRTKLAEQQYVGLKDTIRVLQEENDSFKKENRELETRFVTEKEKLSSEMNKLSEMCDSLKKEVDMLRSLKQEEKRSSWFGLGSITPKETGSKPPQPKEDNGRKFDPNLKVVIPSAAKQKITAHTAEGSCIRYDGSGLDLVATGSADSTVKVWDTGTGSLRSTLRGGGSNAIISCDLSNGVVVGGGSDKTCRVWNLRTERMVHHLVGHAHKITCVRLFNGEKGVITGSADRSLQVWDISRQTYRQTATLRHSSTANGVDIGIDSTTAVSAHLDGGLRFWDIRTGDRTADISKLHEGAITSVQFHPTDSSMVLTNGMDSCMKVVDVRTGTALQTLRHKDFQTSFGWSSGSFSPDGKYVACGSNSNGAVLVWDSKSGELKTKLKAHEIGVCGVAWSSGGSNGQQVASVDKKGTLIMWA